MSHTSFCRWMIDGLPYSFWLTTVGFPSSLFLSSSPASSLWRQTRLNWVNHGCTEEHMCHLLSVCALYLCCYSLQLKAAPWAFLCRLGGADHKGRSRAIQTGPGWGRVSGSLRRKQCGRSHMTPRRGSRRLPLGWGVSAPSDTQRQSKVKQGRLESRDIMKHICVHA